MIRRVCLTSDIDTRNFNTANHHDTDPYWIVNGGMIIDVDWYASLTDQTRQSLCNRLEFDIGHVPLKHCDQDSKEHMLIYRTYIEGFDLQHWSESSKVLIPSDVKKALAFMVLNGRKPSIYDEELSEFESKVQSMMEMNQQYFVKLSGTSGKQQTPIRPFSSAADIMTHLGSVRQFYDREYRYMDKETFLSLTPWTEMDSRMEFRLFVCNEKLTAFSPQVWFKCHNYSDDELNTIECAILQWFSSTSHPYTSFVADVWVDVRVDSQCKLIEYNPFGAHSGAGSSLYNWITDWNTLHCEDSSRPTEFRFISVVDLSSDKK